MTEPGPKVLLIDDEPNLLFGLRALIRRAGFEVITAIDGRDGLLRARTEHPDLIVCDLMMPPPDGLALKELLDSDPATAGIPFIFLTARAEQADKVAGLSKGADDYITKPFDSAELLERMRAVLRRETRARARGQSEEAAKNEALRRFLHAAAQVVGKDGQAVEQLEFSASGRELWTVCTREDFERDLMARADDNRQALVMLGVRLAVMDASDAQSQMQGLLAQLLEHAGLDTPVFRLDPLTYLALLGDGRAQDAVERALQALTADDGGAPGARLIVRRVDLANSGKDAAAVLRELERALDADARDSSA